MQAPAIVTPVRDMGEAVQASLANALGMFLSAVPRIIGFVIVLLIGWFVASLIGRGVAALLRHIRFNELAQRSGFAGFVQKMGVRYDPSGLTADVVKWFVRLITLVVAFDTLGLPAVSGVLQQLLLWLPNLIVALVILIIGGLAAGGLSRLVRVATAEAGFSNPDVTANVAGVAVWAFAIVVAVNQLGIATSLINTLLIGVVGAVALAAGLAFGLGGRDKAAQMLERTGAPARSMAAHVKQPTPAVRSGGWRERSGGERRSAR